MNKPDLSGQIARWILLLQEFNYEVIVKPGKANANADYLSRQRGTEALEDIQAEFPDEFRDEPDGRKITCYTSLVRMSRNFPISLLI